LELFIFQLFILGPQLCGILTPQMGDLGLPVLGVFRLKSGFTWLLRRASPPEVGASIDFAHLNQQVGEEPIKTHGHPTFHRESS